jgi:hypothetical protein
MTSIDYDIDGDDTIVRVNDGFWRFARENHGVLEESAVLGANLFRFVDGPLTAGVYRALHRFVRGTEMPLRFPYRWDSPDRLRFMGMTISPLAGMGPRIRNLLVRESSRPDGGRFQVCHRKHPAEDPRTEAVGTICTSATAAPLAPGSGRRSIGWRGSRPGRRGPVGFPPSPSLAPTALPA